MHYKSIINGRRAVTITKPILPPGEERGAEINRAIVAVDMAEVVYVSPDIHGSAAGWAVIEYARRKKKCFIEHDRQEVLLI